MTMVVSVAFLLIGFMFIGFGVVILKMGIPFSWVGFLVLGWGIVWTLVVLAALGYHAFNLFSERGVAETVVEFDVSPQSEENVPPPASTEERLRELDDLRRKGCITEQEHEEQRKRILEQL